MCVHVHMATVHWLPHSSVMCMPYKINTLQLCVFSSVTVTASGRSAEETTRGGCIGEHTGDQDART